ncbi:MAG: hypothetical protein KHX03_08950 [Clostridium sp.]|nr:hypothetical protein [Clostridium sp.]
MICSRSFNTTDFNLIQQSKQIFSDCYMLSSLEALAHSTQGRNVLSDNVQRLCLNTSIKSENFKDIFCKNTPSLENALNQCEVFRVRFKNVKGNQEDFFISQNNPKYSEIWAKQKNPVIFAFESAMSELLKKYPDKKPLISKIVFPFKKNFEYNKVSNFMEMFTGKKPYILAETSFNLNLKPYKKEVYKLFERLGNTNSDDYSFVVGSGMKKMDDGRRWHCYTVLHVDNDKKRIVLLNKRTNEPREYGFDEAIKKLKYFVGYFNEDLK